MLLLLLYVQVVWEILSSTSESGVLDQGLVERI